MEVIKKQKKQRKRSYDMKMFTSKNPNNEKASIGLIYPKKEIGERKIWLIKLMEQYTVIKFYKIWENTGPF